MVRQSRVPILSRGRAGSSICRGIAMPQLQSQSQPQSATDAHGWINNETVRTRFGDFEFRNGYPTRESAEALHDQLKFNRAIEVYLTQIPAVAVMETRRGIRRFGVDKSNKVIIWETLMDARTLVLTANTETVYGL